MKKTHNTQQSKLLVKICINKWENASRDKKELAVCRDLGADIKVVAKGNSDDSGRVEMVEGYEVHRISTRPVKWLPSSLNRIISILTWAKYVRDMHADIISGHDITGLTIAWFSNILLPKNKKAKLVYDSHEFEIGINIKRNRFQIFMIALWERYLIGKSEFMIVVNDSIADEVVKIHKLKKRPIVVRNIPSNWTIDEEECKKVREQFLADFGIVGGRLMRRTSEFCRMEETDWSVEQMNKYSSDDSRSEW